MVKFLDKRRNSEGYTPEGEADLPLMGEEAVPQEAQEDAALQTRRTYKPEVQDPVDLLIGKTFQFILDQPEFYQVLQLPKYERKRLERAVAKMLTRFPHMNKVING